MTTQGIEPAVFTEWKIRFLKMHESLYKVNKHIYIYLYDIVYCPTLTII